MKFLLVCLILGTKDVRRLIPQVPPEVLTEAQTGALGGGVVSSWAAAIHSSDNGFKKL